MGTVVEALVANIFDRTVDNRDGALADYIPELAAVEPDSFGICVATVDGHVYEVGDTRVPFTIQSISKPFTYALALADHGSDAIAAKIDVEPSGEAFNEISLDPDTGRPRNPMINAGAITAAAMVAGQDADSRFERLLRTYSRYAGRELTFNDSVHTSESRTGHRNRAIGHMLRSFGIIACDPDEAVDLYFRQCSINVTCRDLSLMAATMANNGVNPVTGDTVLDPVLTERVLSVMSTCGMYDAAGKWLCEVGLPAKSGVGGGVIAVLPGQVGIAIYSPRLDSHGNSVRGVMACRALSSELELHFLHVTRAARSAIRASYSVSDAPSRMRRTSAERAALDDVGKRGRIYELHGDLLFAGAETAVREIGGSEEDLEAVVVDIRRVDEVGAIACRMIEALRVDFAKQGLAIAFVDPVGLLGNTQSDLSGSAGRVYADLDSAVQWCEDILLDRHCSTDRQSPSVAVAEHPMLSSLSPEQLERFTDTLEIRTYPRGEYIVRRGDATRGLFLLLSGQVSTTITDQSGATHRIVTLSAGMSFGEMTTILGSRFLNDVRTDTPVTVALLTADLYDEMASVQPELKLALLERLASGAYEQLDLMLRSLLGQGSGR
ncbi:glutaminase A [Rhodococcus sp. NPDC049939]|uniref:glutaminase A n=1 Tax=Rhodococcus sp. NPDC049939 TaxID=3155511 RepID=UPI00340D5A2F